MPATVEELEAQLAALKKQADDSAASVSALNAKNRELLGEKKGTQDKLRLVYDKLGIKDGQEDELDKIAESLTKPGEKPDKQVDKIRAQL